MFTNIKYLRLFFSDSDSPNPANISDIIDSHSLGACTYDRKLLIGCTYAKISDILDRMHIRAEIGEFTYNALIVHQSLSSVSHTRR
jgi:hypothetical protein